MAMAMAMAMNMSMSTTMTMSIYFTFPHYTSCTYSSITKHHFYISLSNQILQPPYFQSHVISSYNTAQLHYAFLGLLNRLL